MAGKFGIPEGSSIDLPIQQIDDEAKKQELAIAKLTESKEWKELRKHFEERKAYYQLFLPGGQEVKDKSLAEIGEMWMVATKIIAELDAVIVTYEEIAKSVRGN
jgi:hypothetical protein